MRHFRWMVLLFLASCAEAPQGPVVVVQGPVGHEVAISVSAADILEHLGGAHYVRVFDETDSAIPVPHQLDDLDMDGQPDTGFILVGPANQTVRLLLEAASAPADYPRRAQAVLAVRQGGRFEGGVYVDGSDYASVDAVDVPTEQEQDSDWAMWEGPVWESDLIGWRYYLDDRNRTDIFGKKTPELVLDHHHDDYHTISEWGADVLKVNFSLGIGSPAMETSSGPQTIDNATARRVEIPANGPLRAIIRSIYKGWMVEGASFDVVSELENRAGQRWTEQRLTLDGDSTDVRMLTGIVKHPDAPDLVSGEEAGIFFMYTYGVQTDQGHNLGMAVLVPPDFAPELGNPDSLSHLVRMTPVDDRVVYRFMASWEMEPNAASDAASFEVMVRSVASAWAEERSLQVAVQLGSQ